MPRFPTRPALALLGALLGLAACAPTATVSVSPMATRTHVPTVAAMASPSPTVPDCSSFTPEPVFPAPQLPFALPPHTVWNELGGAAGANMVLACTPGTSPGAIDAFLNTELAHAGWQHWDPQTERANACAHANDYWRWSNGGEAVGWSYDVPLPTWFLAFCNLAYGG